ncbi:MAG: type III polyketide synthase [Phycisphaerales bacterium]
MNTPRLLGLGTAVPAGTMTQANAAAYAATRASGGDAERAMLARIYRNTTVGSRASVLFDAAAPDSSTMAFFECEPNPLGPTTAERMRRFEREAPLLAHDAALKALSDARLPASLVTHLVTVSCTGMSAPGVDCALVASLGLRPDVLRTNIGFMGCYGAIVGLRTASAIAAADPCARVLLVCVELCSLHYQPLGRGDQAVANALFSDGAAAAVIASDGPGARLLGAASLLFPDTAGCMSWRMGDHGCAMTLAPEVPRLIREHLGPWLRASLESRGLSVPAVRGWAIHPGGPRVLDAVQAGLDLRASDLDASRSVLARHGNMSSGTVLFVLEELIRSASAPWPSVLLAFGPGLCAEMFVLGGPSSSGPTG